MEKSIKTKKPQSPAGFHHAHAGADLDNKLMEDCFS